MDNQRKHAILQAKYLKYQHFLQNAHFLGNAAATMNHPTTAPSVPFFIARTAPDGQQCDAWPEQSLLLSLEQGGIDWPSSCRNGSCRTCIGQLAEGQVRYSIDWPGLTPEERASGCVLPCVAHPLSDVVLEMPGI